MSAKSRRKPTQVNLAPKPPRDMTSIQEEYGRLVSQAGQAQYQIFVYEQDLERINEGLRNLNYEAAQRQQQDAKAASQPKEESTNEPVQQA